MAVGASGANAELVRVMRAVCQFLKWRIHLVARRAELFGRSELHCTKETAGESNACKECEKPPDGYS